MPAAWLSDVQGTVEASDADLPLVIRTARGFGQVIFFAGDLDEPPLRAWPDRPLLVGRLLDLPAGRTTEAGEKRGHAAPRIRRSGRPVAQRARSFRGRPALAVLACRRA